MNRLMVIVGAAAATLALTSTSLAEAGAPPAPPLERHSSRAAAARTGVGVLALDWGDLDVTRRAGRGDYLVMQPWEFPRIPAMRAANPHVRILMYKDVSATVRQAHETGIYPTGVSYREAATRHPGWFLTDRSGQRLEWSDWTGLFPMDVGNRGYQRRWGRNVLSELRAHDWDGVMLDDTLTYLSHSTVGDRVSTQIPDDRAMYRATRSFLAHVGPRVRRAGYLAIPNVTVEWNTWKPTLQDWSRYVSGWENEYFVKWGLSRQSRFEGPDWRWKMRMAAWCAHRRLPLLAITYSDRSDRATMDYHRATWLLTWNGRTGASIFVPAEEGASHWVRRANTYLGAPTGRRRHVDGVWSRPFTRGRVLVNPTTRTRQVSVGDGYRTLAGRSTTVVRLAPRSAALLRR